MKDSPFKDVLKFGAYQLTTDDDVEWVCNLCGERFEVQGDVLSHIAFEHMDDTLPDVDPAA